MSDTSPCTPSHSVYSPSGAERSGGSETSQATAHAGGAERSDFPGGLYVVATPIGNLGDITLRARNALAAADIVLCEDTRVTGKLLNAFGLRVPMLSYHEHNAAARRPEILQRLQGGEVVVLVSDAGTPLISDPGYKLVRDAQDADLPVTPLPGASALLAGLMGAGLPTDRFVFEGFLPNKRKARRDVLQELASIRATLVFYESPNRLAASLQDMTEILGEREAVVGRELTKRFEEIRRAPLRDLAEHYDVPPKGEVVVMVAPPSAVPREISEEELEGMLRAALAEQSLRDAVASVTETTGLPRKRVYKMALALKDRI